LAIENAKDTESSIQI